MADTGIQKPECEKVTAESLKKIFDELKKPPEKGFLILPEGSGFKMIEMDANKLKSILYYAVNGIILTPSNVDLHSLSEEQIINFINK